MKNKRERAHPPHTVKVEYTEVRFPGGKGFKGAESHSACGVLLRRVVRNRRKPQTDVIEALVIPYNPPLASVEDDEKERVFDEQPEQTLCREFHEETGVLISKADFFELGMVSVDDRRPTAIGLKHWRYAYAIHDNYDISNLRRAPSPYQENIGIPYWIPVKALLATIAPAHQWIVAELLRYLPNIPRDNIKTIYRDRRSWFNPRFTSVVAA